MAWTPVRTNWQAGDSPTETDWNNLMGNLLFLYAMGMSGGGGGGGSSGVGMPVIAARGENVSSTQGLYLLSLTNVYSGVVVDTAQMMQGVLVLLNLADDIQSTGWIDYAEFIAGFTGNGAITNSMKAGIHVCLMQSDGTAYGVSIQSLGMLGAPDGGASDSVVDFPTWTLSVDGNRLMASDGDITPPLTQNIESGYTFVATLPVAVTTSWRLLYEWIDQKTLTMGGADLPFGGSYAAGRHILQYRDGGIVSLGMLGSVDGSNFGGGGGADPSVLEKTITSFPGGSSGPASELIISAVGDKATDRYYNHRLQVEVWVTQPSPTDPVPAKWFLAYITTGWLPGADSASSASAIVVNTPGRSNQINGVFAVATSVNGVAQHTVKITGMQNGGTAGSELRVRIRHLDGLDISQWTVVANAP